MIAATATRTIRSIITRPPDSYRIMIVNDTGMVLRKERAATWGRPYTEL
jgi:hypothetical protein